MCFNYRVLGFQSISPIPSTYKVIFMNYLESEMKHACYEIICIAQRRRLESWQNISLFCSIRRKFYGERKKTYTQTHIRTHPRTYTYTHADPRASKHYLTESEAFSEEKRNQALSLYFIFSWFLLKLVPRKDRIPVSMYFNWTMTKLVYSIT